jgi:hypothetical protein
MSRSEELILISLKAKVYISSGSSLVFLQGLLIKEARVKAQIKLSKAIKSCNFSLRARF